MEIQIWLIELVAELLIFMLKVFSLVLSIILFIYWIKKLSQKNSKFNRDKLVPENPEVLWGCPECGNSNPNTTFI